MTNDIPRPSPAKPIRFLDQFRTYIRIRGMAKREVEQFLSHLASQRHVAINTQKTALCALFFLYREFLQKPIDHMDIIKAKKKRDIPGVFSHAEALLIIDQLSNPYQLMAWLVYSSGLCRSGQTRLMELNLSQ